MRQPQAQQMEVGQAGSYSVAVDGNPSDYRYMWHIGYSYDTTFDTSVFQEIGLGLVTPDTFECTGDGLTGFGAYAEFSGGGATPSASSRPATPSTACTCGALCSRRRLTTTQTTM